MLNLFNFKINRLQKLHKLVRIRFISINLLKILIIYCVLLKK